MQIKEVDVEKTEIFSIGRQYSHNVLVIHFVNLPNLKNKYIYYKIDDIEEEIPLVSDLFIVSRPLTMHSGKVKAQIIVRDEANETIGLTKNFTMIIKASNYSGIGEDENYPDDLNIKNYFVKIDEKVNSFEELANLVQTKLDNGEFIGAQGPKGDPGDVTEEYRNLAMQIAQNASDAQTSATNAQVSATAARKSLDDAKEFVNQTKSEMNQIKNDTSALKEEANTSATNAKASETKAEEYANNLQNSTETISQLKEDLAANTKEDAKTKRSLSALWNLNKGISYRFETDSEKAYKKQIPSGAKLASVNKVGGKTIVMNQLIDPSKRDIASIEFDESTKHFKYNDWNDIGVKYICKNINLIGGHKYYIYATDKVRYTILYLYGDSLKESFAGSNVAETEIKKIITATSNGANNLYFNRYMALPENVSYFDGCINLIDLTKMFGPGNEPSTPEEFKAMFPNDYYAYNEGELMSMSVNDVDVVGKNIFECEHFSCSGFKEGNSIDLSNAYGTSINSTEPSNRVTVTQSKVEQEDTNISYLNGYFCVAFKPFSLDKEYVFSFDVIPSNKLISNPKVIVLMNGNKSINVEYAQDLQIGKRGKLYFNLKANDKELRYIEIRNSGISGIFENFQIEEGSINTSYSPYTKKSYPIPQSIQNLDGYGWSAGTAYNYVDFENKKYYKCVDKVDLSSLEWRYFNGIYYVELYKAQINEKNYILCNKYTSDDVNIQWNTPEGCITLYNQYVYIKDSSIDSNKDFKESLIDVVAYYSLQKPIVIDISELIGDTFQEPFEVESGGSLTFKNTNGDGYQVAVPSDIQYVVSLSEVNA